MTAVQGGASKIGTVAVEAMHAADWDQVARIYAEGISTGHATFETSVPGWAAWDTSHLREHRFVARRGGEVAGWIAVSAVSSRCAYEGVVEDSVYVSERARGAGIGRMLLERLIESTEAAGIWTIETGIFPENVASLALHESCGFRRVGVRERLGRLEGRWRDVVLLERRSVRI
jgi:phosphinothricin acetyltransferase